MEHLLFMLIGILLANAASAKLSFDQPKINTYWGQNSGGGQTRLSHYCANEDIDIVTIAFVTAINHTGPVQFTLTNQDPACNATNGTMVCPEVEDDIRACKAQNKTIMLSLGGALYSGESFEGADDAIDAAQLVFDTFGPVSSHPAALNITRPFGNVSVDGFDLDFEKDLGDVSEFAAKIRHNIAKSNETLYLSAAPGCAFPDPFNSLTLNQTYFDFVNVQFYGEPCGVDTFIPGKKQNTFNFHVWNKWVQDVSPNPDAKILLGVAGGPTAAATGYENATQLAGVVELVETMKSFGGVSIWDAAQATKNTGFLPGIRGLLTVREEHFV